FGGPKTRALSDADRRRALVEVLPWLRGRLSGARRVVATIQDDPKMLRFVSSVDGPRLAELGTSCPAHFLRTKIKPLFGTWDPASGDRDRVKRLVDEGLEKERED